MAGVPFYNNNNNNSTVLITAVIVLLLKPRANSMLLSIINHKLILIQLGQQHYYYLYLYGQKALAIARAITDHTCTSKSTDYCPNYTRKCVILYYLDPTCNKC
jgi:hypothetical protein